MSQKELHIVFSPVASATLRLSEQLDPDKVEILAFLDSLSGGPLCDLGDVEGIEQRKDWYTKVLGTPETEDELDFIDDDLNLLRKITNDAQNYSEVYLWLGDSSQERIIAARLLFHIQGVSTPIYKVNFSKVVFKNAEGRRLDLYSLLVMAPEQVAIAAQHFEPLTTAERETLVSLWEQLRKDRSTVHVFDKSGNYRSGDDTFFDSFLLNRFTDIQRSTSIVGHTLCDIWEEFGGGCVGDLFLFHRLNRLGEMGKVEISDRHENPERGRIIFMVRKGE